MRTQALLMLSLSLHVAAGWAAGAGTYPPAPPELAAAAREVVRRAVGREVDLPGAVLGATGHNPDTVILQGPEVSASVDAQSGLLVRHYDYSGCGTEPGPPILREEEARVRAEAFLARAGLALPDPWRLYEALYNPYGMGPHYTFSWGKFVLGVRLPSAVSADIDAATGLVQCLFLYDDPVTVPLRPRLSADQAVAAAAAHLKVARPSAPDAELAVWYRPHWPAGPQYLLWRMELTDLDTGKVRTVEVDANTGEVASVRESMGANRTSKTAPAGTTRPRLHPRLDPKAAGRAKVPPTLFQLAGKWKWALRADTRPAARRPSSRSRR